MGIENEVSRCLEKADEDEQEIAKEEIDTVGEVIVLDVKNWIVKNRD